MESHFPLMEFVNAGGDAVLDGNREGKVWLGNPATERLFGYSAHEAPGQLWGLITLHRFRDAHRSGFHRAMQTGETRLGSDLHVTALHKAGRELPIALTVGVVRDAYGQIAGIGAIIREDSRLRKV